MTTVTETNAAIPEVVAQAIPTIVAAISAAQTQIVANTVAEATQHWVLRREEKNLPKPTDQETVEFQQLLAARIQASQSRKATLETRQGRQERKAIVLGKAEALHVKFFHHRSEVNTELATALFNTVIKLANSNTYTAKDDRLADILHSTVDDLEKARVPTCEISSTGGATVAFKYVLQDGKLGMQYVVAFCREDENFDPIIGMEESLKKFTNGPLQYTEITHDRFGAVKRAMLINDYKSLENKASVLVTPSN